VEPLRRVPDDLSDPLTQKCEAADGDRRSWANGDHGELANGQQAEVTGSGEFVAGMSEARQAEVRDLNRTVRLRVLK
jgi:hypothetical protein